MKAKMIFTEIVRDKLRELEIKTRNAIKGRDLIIIDGNDYWFVTPKEFNEKQLHFLEQRDLLKMTPEIKIGDYVQIYFKYGYFIREVSKITGGNIVTVKASPAQNVPPVTYNMLDVKRVPDYLVKILKDEEFIND